MRDDPALSNRQQLPPADESEPRDLFMEPFFSPSCLTHPQWKKQKEARRKTGQWQFTPAEKEHIATCTVCRRLKQMFEADNSQPQPAPRPTRWGWSRWLPMSLAASLLLAVGIGLVVHSNRLMPPPEYVVTDRLSNTDVGPGGNPSGGYILTWSLPHDLGGFLSVFEIVPDLPVEVRPGEVATPLKVEPRRSTPKYELPFLFVPDHQKDKTIWLLLTDKPAVRALETAKSSNKLRDNFSEDRLTILLCDLNQQGINVLAIGRFTLSPSK